MTEAPAHSDGDLHVPVEALPRLLTARLRPSDAVRVEGPVTVDDPRRVFPGY